MGHADGEGALLGDVAHPDLGPGLRGLLVHYADLLHDHPGVQVVVDLELKVHPPDHRVDPFVIGGPCGLDIHVKLEIGLPGDHVKLPDVKAILIGVE